MTGQDHKSQKPFGSYQPQSRPIPERRALVRSLAKSSVTVFRQTDLVRAGVEGRLRDITVCGLGLVLPVALQVGELIELELRNEIQRLQKKASGIVRHVTPMDDGRFLVGVELRVRLTPLEVSLLKLKQ